MGTCALFLFQKKQIEGKAFVHCPLHQNEYPPKECEVFVQCAHVPCLFMAPCVDKGDGGKHIELMNKFS